VQAGAVAPASNTPAAPPAAGAINMQQIATLQDIGTRAGTDLVGEVLRSFLAEAEEQMARLEGAVNAEDAPLLTRCAHAMKSSTANFGAVELSALYRRMEALGRNKQLDQVRPLLHDLRQMHERVVRRAREILQEAA
jgi:HPt (histidine-containing phosphotransfer) domain-containing protein